MLFFRLPMENFDVDSFIMPVSAGPIGLHCTFTWPTEIQRQYDNQLRALNDYFASIPCFTLIDPRNVTYPTLSVITEWNTFVAAWEAADTAAIQGALNNSVWPFILQAQVEAVLDDPTNSLLHDSIQSMIATVQPLTDYLDFLAEKLIWTIEVRNGTERRVACINPNTWLFYSYNDWRLCFVTDQPSITRDNLTEVVLYIAIGAGDIE